MADPLHDCVDSLADDDVFAVDPFGADGGDSEVGDDDPFASPSSRDRSARELIGTVAEIRWRANDGGGFTVVALANGDVATCLDPYEDLRIKLSYRFLGKWTTHERHGERFSADTFVRHVPHDRDGIIAYLCKTAPHVGPTVAAKLWDAYGSDAATMLRTRPDEISAAGIMPAVYAREAADKLQLLAGTENVRIDLAGLFAGRGFPRTLIDAAINRWGLRAPDRIRRDPYCLMVHGLPGCGFLRCDALYLSLGRPAHRLKRQMLCCWKALDDLAGSGHTWAQVERVSRELTKKVGMAARPRDALRLGIRAQWIARRRDDAGQLWIAVAENAQHEAAIAERVHALLDWHPPSAAERQTERDRLIAEADEEEWDNP